MPKLPPARTAIPTLAGLELVNRGKVRDTYRLSSGLLLVVATDAISIFDFVLNATVPQKGMMLTAMTHWWLTRLHKAFGLRHHMIAAGAAIDEWLPKPLRGNIDLQSRAMVVRPLNMYPVEFIARMCLTGSGLSSYNKTGSVCGIELPMGLQDGDELPRPIATPTTKATQGHDEHVPAAEIADQYPEATELLLKIASFASDTAADRGIRLADTKLEFGTDPEDGTVFLGDEVLTPDSSRYWEDRKWEVGRRADKRSSPPSLDKQTVREWGKKAGIEKKEGGVKREPENADDVAFVHGVEVPQDLLAATTRTYRYIFWRLTGLTVEQYFAKHLGVTLPTPQKKVAIVLGSRSDLATVRPAVERIAAICASNPGQITDIAVHVISCHRNPFILDRFAADRCNGADVVICVGGLALALPGVLQARLAAMNPFNPLPVSAVALGRNASTELQAARLSIEELPGKPVIINEVGSGRCYVGEEGLYDLLLRVHQDELPGPNAPAEKHAEWNVFNWPPVPEAVASAT